MMMMNLEIDSDRWQARQQRASLHSYRSIRGDRGSARGFGVGERPRERILVCEVRDCQGS